MLTVRFTADSVILCFIYCVRMETGSPDFACSSLTSITVAVNNITCCVCLCTVTCIVFVVFLSVPHGEEQEVAGGPDDTSVRTRHQSVGRVGGEIR